MKRWVKTNIIFCVSFLVFFIIAFDSSADTLNSRLYPGVKASQLKIVPYAPVKPNTKAAFNDVPESYLNECHAGKYTAKVKVCKYGYTQGYKYTVAIIGDSHSGHWLGAVQQFANKHQIRILYATKSGCALTTEQFANYQTCNIWNRNIIPTIARYKPDLVLTKADYAMNQSLPQGFINKYNELGARNIQVFAIRDTMYFKKPVPECIRTYGRNSVYCKLNRMISYPELSAWDKLSIKPINVHYFDYSNKMCDKKYCHPVQGNLIIMRDYHHMTNSYSKTFGPYIERDMLPILKTIREKRN